MNTPHQTPKVAPASAPPQLPHERYSRVIAVVGGAARFRRNAKWQGLTLADVARGIPQFREFCRLCSADMQDTWFNDRDNKVRTTDNRCETWERLYRHWYGHHGTREHPPAIRVRAVGRSGFYVVEAAIERRSAERIWSSVAKACRAAKIPEHLIDAFQRDNEHYYEEHEAVAAQAGAPSGITRGKAPGKTPVKALASNTPPL